MYIDLVVVLYNKLIANTEFVALLDESESLNSVLLVDNSTDSVLKKRNCEILQSHPSVSYIDMHGNFGLAKAYNTAIKISTADYVMLLDDDTVISPNQLQLISRHIEKTHSDIFVPIVKAGKDYIMSPCNIKGSRFVPIKELDDLKRPFSAINSGLVIKRQIFDTYLYDERYFLDMIDHKFMQDMFFRNASFEIMRDVTLSQNYSFLNDSRQSALNRYRIYCKDSKVFYSDSFRGRLFRFFQLSFRLFRILTKQKKKE